VRRLRLSREKLCIALATFTLVALVGAACGGDSTSATPTTAAASASITKAATTAASPTTAATTSGASPTLIKVGATTSKGNVLTDNAGMSLYTFDNDKTAGSSSCNGGCATTWPPVAGGAAAPSGVTGASGTFSLITRDDGAKQVAYNGKPLYRYAPDKAPGDTNGDGVGNVWHLAKP
jgi:predicted lipoprotein with Yx(FWY)xxD motif